MNRRRFIANTLTSAAALTAGALASYAQTSYTNSPDKTTPSEVARLRGPLDLKLGRTFVRAGHNNLPRVKELIAQEPNLVFASLDWGGGDWETALGGASHTGHREIAEFLLASGARMDSFCAAMLGQRHVALALLKAEPSIATT